MFEKLGLFFDEEVQRLIDSFAYCFKVKITIFSFDMEELIIGLRNPGSAFCQLIQKKLRFRYRCCQQDKMMCERCEKKQELLIYHCYAGLVETVMPIKLGETLIGYAMLGQFRTQKDLSGEILREWIKAGNNREVLRNAFLELPFFDKPTLDNMLRLFSAQMAFIITREYIRIRRPGLAEQVLHWVESHIGDTSGMELDRVAAAMGKSRSTISHTVKRQLGLSFNQLCIITRIQRFESLISGDPNLSIQEAAFKVGYGDPFYFSRAYKKVRLIPPSTYIKSIRASLK
jgi:AraC-like DNA-binding protein